MKKKITMIISRVFPETHSKRGEPTDFANKIASGEKKHTIRSNYDMWNVNAQKMEGGNYYLSLRQWSGFPRKSRLVEIAKRYNPIGVQAIELHYHHSNDTVTATIDGCECRDISSLELAKNEGLSERDFKEWFFGENPHEDKIFKGCIVHFTNLEY